MTFFLVREEVKGYMEYVTEANTEEEAIAHCLELQDTYPAATDYTITEEIVVEAAEIDLDDIDDLDYNVSRAIKWLMQDSGDVEEDDKPKRKRRKKTTKKVKTDEAELVQEIPEPVKSKVPDWAVDT